MNTRLKTKIIMVVAKTICRTIHSWRCRSFLRRLDDFRYEVKDLRQQYTTEGVYNKAVASLPFYTKKVLVNDDSERTVAIKLGDCMIKYSFDKLIKYLDVVPEEPLTETTINENVAIALVKATTKNHRVASIINFNRKERDGQQTRKSSS
tara:strand:- start:2291 stop:2740 length:450 start_codon:yes stop_codon:yes gene_type:complete